MNFFGSAAPSTFGNFSNASNAGFNASSNNFGGGSGSFGASSGFGNGGAGHQQQQQQRQQQQRQGRGGGNGGKGSKKTGSPGGRGGRGSGAFSSGGGIPLQPPPPANTFGGGNSFGGGFGGNSSGGGATFGAKPFGKSSPKSPRNPPGRKFGGGSGSPNNKGGARAASSGQFVPAVGGGRFGGNTFTAGGTFGSSGGAVFQPPANMGAAAPFGVGAAATTQPVQWGQQQQQQQQQQQNRRKSQGKGNVGVAGRGGGMEVEQAPKARKPRQQKQPQQQFQPQLQPQQPPQPFQPQLQLPQQQFQPFQPQQPPSPQQQFQPQFQPQQSPSPQQSQQPQQQQQQQQQFQPNPFPSLSPAQFQPSQVQFTPQAGIGSAGGGMDTEQSPRAGGKGTGGKGQKKGGKGGAGKGGGGGAGVGQMETEGGATSGGTVCNNWRKSGTCKFGADCRFVHSKARSGAGGAAAHGAGVGTPSKAGAPHNAGGEGMKASPGGGGANGKGTMPAGKGGTTGKGKGEGATTGKGKGGGKGGQQGKGVCRFGARCNNRKCAYEHPERAPSQAQPQQQQQSQQEEEADGQGATPTSGKVGGGDKAKRSLKDRMGAPPMTSPTGTTTKKGAAAAAKKPSDAGAGAGLTFTVSNRGKGVAARLGDQNIDAIKKPSPMKVGQRVQALYEGEWWPAIIVQVHGNNHVDVQYLGLSGEDAMEYGKAWGTEVQPRGSGDNVDDEEGDEEEEAEEEEGDEGADDEEDDGDDAGEEDDDEGEEGQDNNGAIVRNAHGHVTAPTEGRPSLKSKLGMSPNTTFLSRLMSGVQRTNNRLIAQTQAAARAYKSDVVTRASPTGAVSSLASSQKRLPRGQQQQQQQTHEEEEEEEGDYDDEGNGDPWSAGALRRAQYTNSNAAEEEEEEEEEDQDEEAQGAATTITAAAGVATATKKGLSRAADPWTPGAANNRAQRFQKQAPLPLTPATPATPASAPADTPSSMASSRKANRSRRGSVGRGGGAGGGKGGGTNTEGAEGAEEEVLAGLCSTMAPREALSGQVFEFAYQEFGEAWQDVLVSRHIRSAAGHVYAPEEVRTEAALELTCNHLVSNIMDSDTSPTPRLEHAFGGQPPYTLEVWLYVWNRFRAMRVEYKLQGFLTRGSGSAVGVYEQMARFHLTMDMELQGNTMRNRDRAEIEARGDPIVLSEFYHSEKDSRSAITEVLNELDLLYDAACDKQDISLLGPSGLHGMAEGCGLILLNSMDNDDGTFSSRFLAKLAAREDWAHTLASPPMLFAVAVLATRRRHDFAHFFLLLRSAPYAEGCVMHKYVGGDHGMRAVAIRALHKAWSPADQRIKLSHLTTVLCCSDENETQALLEDFGVISEVDDDDEGVAVFGKDRGNREFVGWPYSAMDIEERKTRYRALDVVLAKRGGPEGPGAAPGIDAFTNNRLYYTSRANIVRGTSTSSRRIPPSSSSSSSSTAAAGDEDIASAYGLNQPQLAGTGAGYSRWQRTSASAASSTSRPLAHVVLKPPRHLSVAATAAATAGVPFGSIKQLGTRSPVPAALAASRASPQSRVGEEARAAAAAAAVSNDPRKKIAAADSLFGGQRRRELEEEAARQKAEQEAVEQKRQQQQEEAERQAAQAQAEARAAHASKVRAEQQALAAQREAAANQQAALSQQAANHRAVARKQERACTWARLAAQWAVYATGQRVRAAAAQCRQQRAWELASCRKLYLRRWVLAYAARAAERERIAHEAQMREAAVREALSSLDVGASTEHYQYPVRRASGAMTFEGEDDEEDYYSGEYDGSSSSNDWTPARAEAATAHWQPAMTAPVRYAASTTGRMIAALGLVPPPSRPQRRGQQQQEEAHQQQNKQKQKRNNDSLGQQLLPLEAVLRRAAYGGGSAGSTTGGGRRAYSTTAALSSSTSAMQQPPRGLGAGVAPGMGQVHRFAAWNKARMEYREAEIDAAWYDENDEEDNNDAQDEQDETHEASGDNFLSLALTQGQQLLHAENDDNEDLAVVEGVGAALEAVALVQRQASYQGRSASSLTSSSSAVRKRARSAVHTATPFSGSTGAGTEGALLPRSSRRLHPGNNKRLPSASMGGGGSSSSSGSSGVVKRSRVSDASRVSTSPGGDRSRGSSNASGSGGAALAPEASAVLDAERALAQSRKAATATIAAAPAASGASTDSKPAAYSYAAALRASAPPPAPAPNTAGAGLSTEIYREKAAAQSFEASLRAFAVVPSSAYPAEATALGAGMHWPLPSKAPRRSLPANTETTHQHVPHKMPRHDQKATKLQIENAAYEARLRELML